MPCDSVYIIAPLELLKTKSPIYHSNLGMFAQNPYANLAQLGGLLGTITAPDGQIRCSWKALNLRLEGPG